MRKLLLASVAMLGGSLGIANAQVMQNTPPGPAGTLVPNPVNSVFTATPGTTPASPGTVSVRLNARLNAYVMAGTDSGRSPGLVTTAAGAAPTASNTKLSNYSLGEYARIYPGFDGVAGNGLKYGASLEIRQDQASAPGGGTGPSISASNRSRAGLYWRRETAYIASDTLGQLRYGSTDGPSSLMITGVMENFNDGGWNGDLPGYFTGNSTPTYPFLDVGAWYSTSKVVYLSPQFFGFDFGVAFEPNTGAMNLTPGNCSYANTAASTASVSGGSNAVGCDATASSTVGAELGRRRNLIDAQARYRGAFGPVGIALQAGYLGSGRVTDSSVVQNAVQFNNISIGDFGGQVTFGGLTVGGHADYGSVNGQGGLLPKGQKSSFAWVGGVSYAMGPFIVGTSYFDYKSAGSKNVTTPANVGRRDEYGISVGGTYTFAPGMNVFVNYLYGHRAEGGVDLLTGVGSTAAVKTVTHNNVQANGILLGTQFRW